MLLVPEVASDIQKVTHDCFLELTFRQACTADRKGEVEFLDVNHYITTDDNFGIVTTDFVKVTQREGSLLTENHTTQSQHSNLSYLKQ